MNKHFLIYFILCVNLACAPAVLAADVGRETGLPLPRFVSLKSSEINMRKGPGTRYPIEWVYRRDRLPVEIIEEFEHWRQVRDHEGTIGWAHKNMLSGERTVLILGKEPVALYEDEEDDEIVAMLETGVIASLKKCTRVWCKIEVQKHKGWLKKPSMFGVYDKELYNP